MTFTPGHANVGPALPSRSPVDRKMVRNIAEAVRRKISPDTMAEFHLQIAAGQPAILTRDPDSGDWGVGVEENGFRPTLRDRTDAMRWLTDRGYGQAPQMLHLEAELKAQIATANIHASTGQLQAGALAQLARILRGGSLTPAATPAPALDVPRPALEAPSQPAPETAD